MIRIRLSIYSGDEIVLADANFPAASVAATTTAGLISADGHDIPELLEAIMTLLPLDETAPPCAVMEVMPQHKAEGLKTPVWEKYKSIVEKHEGREIKLEEVERFAFYERAKKAFAVVSTGDVNDPPSLLGFFLLPLPILLPYPLLSFNIFLASFSSFFPSFV